VDLDADDRLVSLAGGWAAGHRAVGPAGRGRVVETASMARSVAQERTGPAGDARSRRRDATATHEAESALLTGRATVPTQA
jgi:hypothetical protein